FPAPYADICDGARASRLYKIQGATDGDGEGDRDLSRLPMAGLAEARAEFSAALAPVVAAGEAAHAPASLTRPTVIPATAPFLEIALPPAYRGPRPPATRPSRDVAGLPEGFLPVRFE